MKFLNLLIHSNGIGNYAKFWPFLRFVKPLFSLVVFLIFLLPFCKIARGQKARHQSNSLGTIVINIQTTEPSCGYDNGIIVATASGGTSPYLYSLSGGFNQNNGYFPGYGAGKGAITYTVAVTDAAGRTATQEVTLSNTLPAPVVAVNIVAHASTCTSADGSVTLTASGGVPPYQYSKDGINFGPSNSFNNLIQGVYWFYVQDANGCIADTALGLLSEFNCRNCCDLMCNGGGGDIACKNDGYIDIRAEGGTPPYEFSIDGVNYYPGLYPNESSDFKNLGPGNHTIYVKDATGTIIEANWPLMPRCTVGIAYVAVNASCKQNNGQITIHAVNGTLPYEFSIDGINFPTDSVFTGLAPGNYSVTVRDAQGITSSVIATVNDSCPIVTAIATAATCGQNNGTITATGSKGAMPYSFSIDGINFQAGNTFTALAAGSYTVTIKDVYGNLDSTKVTVANNCLQVSGAPIPSSCNNPNGSITATGSDGTTPYQYSLDGVNFQTSDLFPGLAAGSYTLTVKDATGATGSTTVIVAGTSGPTISVTVTAATCAGADGSLLISATGGTAPYTYSDDGSNFGSSNQFSMISTGSVMPATVEDASGCKATQQTTMTEDCPTIAITLKNETCGSDNGIITANAGGGIAPYSYSTDGSNFQSSNVFNNLNAGSYTLYVKDAKGYKNDTTVKLTNLCPSVSATTTNGACGASAATITATGSGGTPPYLYSIDGINFQAGQNFDNLPDGTYTVTIKDAEGLTSNTTIAVNNFRAVAISLVASPASCLDNDGNMAAAVSGGTAPFTYSLNGGSYQNNSTFASLDTGLKTVMIKDANGCIASQSSIITLNNNLFLNAGADAAICEGTGKTLTATSNGNTFAWSPSTAISDSSVLDPVASPVSTIQYYIQAGLGSCTKIDSVLITVNSAPIALAGMDTAICFGKSVQLSGSGGNTYSWTPPTYLDNPDINDPTVSNPQSSITYFLTVADINGCKSLNHASVNISVTPEAKVFAGNDTAVLVNQAFQLNAIDVDGSGFTSYVWAPSQGLNNALIENPVATIANNITYYVTASTADGCKGTDSIAITVYDVSGIFVPNAFTPNGDGINDVLKPVLIGIKELKYFAIFNRWGQRIFYTTSQGNGWAGSVNGNPSEAGTYVWMTAAIDYRGILIEKKGTVILIR